MYLNEDDNYDSRSRQSSNSGDSGYFGCDSFKDVCSDEDAEIVDMSEEGDPLVLKEEMLFAWWDRVTEESLPFWAAMAEPEPEEDAPKKERLSYIFNALETGIQGFTKFTRALCSAIEDRDQQILELELENRTLFMRNSTLTIERDLLTKERDDLDKEATHLVMRSSTITFERDEAARERDALKKEVEQLKEQNKTLTMQSSVFKKERDEADHERSVMKKEVEQMKEQNNTLVMQNKSITVQSSAVKKERDEVRLEAKKLRVQNSITKKERDGLRVAVDNMRGEAPYHVLARWMETPGYGF